MHIFFHDDFCQPLKMYFVTQKLGAVFQLLALLVGIFSNL